MELHGFSNDYRIDAKGFTFPPCLFAPSLSLGARTLRLAQRYRGFVFAQLEASILNLNLRIMLMPGRAPRPTCFVRTPPPILSTPPLPYGASSIALF
jgi:hypothetical protein